MKIGNLTLANNVILAPLAGITNLPFRLLAKKAGCGLVCSEMVSSHALVYKSRKTAQMLNSVPREKPLSAQIFGSDPDIMAGAAVMVEGMGADILDINFGCAVRKVVKTGAGVALMRTPDRARAMLKAVRNAIRIPLTIKIRSGWDASGEQALNIARLAEDCGVDAVAVHPRMVKTGAGAALMRTPDLARAMLKAVRNAIRIPLTIKIRSGWDASGEQALNIARLAEDCGVDAVAVHPRTAKQLFGGRADWSIIAAVKQALSIPVIGNGDIFSARDAMKMLSETGCDAVMIGRKAIGNPAIFSQVLARISGDESVAQDLAGRFDIMIHYLKTSVECLGEEPACRMMRSRLGWFAKEMHNSSKFRESIKHLSSEKEGIELIKAYKDSLIF